MGHSTIYELDHSISRQASEPSNLTPEKRNSLWRQAKNLNRSVSHQPHLQRQATPEETEFQISSKVLEYRSLSSTSDYETMSKKSSFETRQDSATTQDEECAGVKVVCQPDDAQSQSVTWLSSSNSTEILIPKPVEEFSDSTLCNSSIELAVNFYEAPIDPKAGDARVLSHSDVIREFSIHTKRNFEVEVNRLEHDRWAMDVLMCENVTNDPQLICNDTKLTGSDEVEALISRMRADAREAFIEEELEVSVVLLGLNN